MKRFLVHMLITVWVLGSLLASPAIMASTMPAESTVSDCVLCELDSGQPHSPATASGCAVAACGAVASIADNPIGLGPALRITPMFYVEAHPGRHLEGPDPFPPRVIRV